MAGGGTRGDDQVVGDAGLAAHVDLDRVLGFHLLERCMYLLEQGLGRRRRNRHFCLDDVGFGGQNSFSWERHAPCRRLYPQGPGPVRYRPQLRMYLTTGSATMDSQGKPALILRRTSVADSLRNTRIDSGA